MNKGSRTRRAWWRLLAGLLFALPVHARVTTAQLNATKSWCRVRGLVACPFRKLYPDVMVMQPAQDWDCDNDTGPLDCQTEWPSAQRQVRGDLPELSPPSTAANHSMIECSETEQ